MSDLTAVVHVQTMLPDSHGWWSVPPAGAGTATYLVPKLYRPGDTISDADQQSYFFVGEIASLVAAGKLRP